MNAPLKHPKIPEIVHIVLSQADRHRRAGLISEEFFEGQVRRLTREELEPRCLTLLIRELSDGRTRFLIKRTDSGQVCDMFETDSLASAA
ncbi:MAG TPA: hypothetical protein VF593_07030 [Chthoniobacteraceae bacterium]|jgi:hypothetical protein